MSLSSGLSCGLSGGLSVLSRGGGARAESLVARLAALLGEDASFWIPGPDYWFTDGSASFAASSSQHLSVPSNSSLQTGGVDWWISGWLKQASTTTNRCFAAKDSSVSSREWGVYTGSGTTNLILETSGAARLIAPLGALNQWHHVFLWFDSSDNLCRAVVDGGSTITAASGSPITSGLAPLYLGGRAFVGSLIPWDGNIASVAFGKSPPGGIASVATTIRDRLYASGAGILYADTTPEERTAWGLVSWWDLVRSGVFTDSHGSNHLTNNNGVGFGAGLPRAAVENTDLIRVWADASANGRDLNQATTAARPQATLSGGFWRATFDGVDDWMSGTFTDANVPHSVFAVASLSANGTFPMLIVTRPTVRDLRGNSDTRKMMVVTDSGATVTEDPTALDIGAHYRMVAAYGAAGGQSVLYRDGVSVAFDAADTTTASPNVIEVGARSGSFGWPGQIVAVGVVPSVTLTTTQIVALDAILAEVTP